MVLGLGKCNGGSQEQSHLGVLRFQKCDVKLVLKMALLRVQTPLIARFSTVIHEKGSPETLPDPRGFAVKMYTREGNFDMVGNNMPVFFVRDAMQVRIHINTNPGLLWYVILDTELS